jgi:hypothetical protein
MLTYDYVKYYFWEPQHLLLRSRLDAAPIEAGGPIAPRPSRERRVMAALLRQEVPLNYLLNVLLRVVPRSVRRASLDAFGGLPDDPGLDDLVLHTPRSTAKIQPDVELESSGARVFIELKVAAPLTAAQVQKYVDRHHMLDRDEGERNKYVLLIGTRDHLRLKDVQTSDGGSSTRRIEHGDVPTVLPSLLRDATTVRFASTTWQRLGEVLSRARASRDTTTEAGEMLATLIDDFLADLSTRGLYVPV